MKKIALYLAAVITLTHSAWCMPAFWKPNVLSLDEVGEQDFLARKLTVASVEPGPGFVNMFVIDESGYATIPCSAMVSLQNIKEIESHARGMLSLLESSRRGTLDSNLEKLKRYNPDMPGSLLLLIDPETGLPPPQTEVQQLRAEEDLARALLKLSQAFDLYFLALSMPPDFLALAMPPELAPDTSTENG